LTKIQFQISIINNMTDYKIQFQELKTVSACLALRDQLSTSGTIADLKNQLSDADKVTKISLGQELNRLKQDLKTISDLRIQEIQIELEKDNFTEFDPTFYSKNYFNHQGNLHPITKITNEIVAIFQNMGFAVADGPLVETQEACFTKLNMPDYHPARSMQDTFFLAQKDNIGENYVMRTHTSGVQYRYGSTHKPPIRIVVPGQVYRNEKIDATHDIMFHQIECLYIDKRVSLSHLKTLIEFFYREFFGDSKLVARFRPSYFPYTVPSLEVDISNPFKPGAWLEVGGCGLVHPEVLEGFDIDTSEYQGLAFGFGLDRMAQLKLNLSGLGQFFDGNLKFLEGKK
jgi:phenylalanyl-tRNA synthetase alpha chain